jgi:tetratricopeptide (TPR) repeat protein
MIDESRPEPSKNEAVPGAGRVFWPPIGNPGRQEGEAEAIDAALELKIYKAQERLIARLDLTDKQVADLQMDQVQSKKHWYQDISTLVALFAFLFSLGTTVFSYQQAKQAKIHDARTELRSLIQRLSALPKENLQAQQAYQNNPSAAGQISGLIQQENAFLAKQAAEVMTSIPDQVTSSEYILVANALLNSNLIDQSAELFDRAQAVIKDSNDGVTILRSRAAINFLRGNLQGGRRGYEEALAIFKIQPSGNRFYEETTHALTEMLWAQAELGQKQCPEARTHIARARGHLAQILVNGVPNYLEPQVAQTEGYVNSSCGTAMSAKLP